MKKRLNTTKTHYSSKLSKKSIKHKVLINTQGRSFGSIWHSIIKKQISMLVYNVWKFAQTMPASSKKTSNEPKHRIVLLILQENSCMPMPNITHILGISKAWMTLLCFWSMKKTNSQLNKHSLSSNT